MAERGPRLARGDRSRESPGASVRVPAARCWTKAPPTHRTCRVATQPDPRVPAPAAPGNDPLGRLPDDQPLPDNTAERPYRRVNGHRFLPNCGHRFSPPAAMFSPRWWPSVLPIAWCAAVVAEPSAVGARRSGDGRAASASGQGHHPLAGGGLGEPVAVGAVGDEHVGVVEQPVDGCGGEGLGHQLVEPGGVDVRGERDRALLVGGVDDAEQRLGRVRGDGEQADVVDDDQVGADRAGRSPCGRCRRRGGGGAARRASRACARRRSCPGRSRGARAPRRSATCRCRSVRRRKGSPRGRPTRACAAPAGSGRDRLAARSQASNVLPAGSPEARRRSWIVAWSRPAASSANRTRRTSAGSQRCAAAVATTSGAALRT